MRIGKLPPDILESLVIGELSRVRNDILVRPGIGKDCSVIDFGDYVCIVSSDPITGASTDIGRLSVLISCNDIAASGGTPVGLMMTLLLPTDMTEKEIKDLMREINAAATENGVEIIGGHTEVSAVVTRPVISVTAIGKAEKGCYVTTSGAKPGDHIVVTKALGLEGTAIIASDYRKLLIEKGVAPELADRAAGFIGEISVVKEGLYAARNGATAMHDITEGGLLGGVWELAEASRIGIRIFKERIPIRPETEVICRTLGIDPLALISSGSMLIAATDGERLVKGLAGIGVEASIIGKAVEPSEGCMLVADGVEKEITPPDRDELYEVIERFSKRA